MGAEKCEAERLRHQPCYTWARVKDLRGDVCRPLRGALPRLLLAVRAAGSSSTSARPNDIDPTRPTWTALMTL
jgi:hypothetical protein